MSIIPYTISLALFDSFSTTQQIIIFALLLTTVKPLRNSLSFLAGLIGSYIACGIGGYLALDQLNNFLGKYFPSTQNMSNTSYYQFELISGLAMILIGFWFYRKKRHEPPSPSQNIILTKLKSMNALWAFFIGTVISITSFPLAIPYIVALEKYATLRLSTSAAIENILLYNLGYALPMIAILFIYLYARKQTDDLSGTLQEKTRVLNVQLTTWTLVGVGVFSIIDAGCYFALGQAIVQGRFF